MTDETVVWRALHFPHGSPAIRLKHKNYIGLLVLSFLPDGYAMLMRPNKADELSMAATFSSPEAALLLVSTKNRDLWPGPTTFRF